MERGITRCEGMVQTTINRAKAAAVARGAQAAAVLLLVAGAALGMLGVPGTAPVRHPQPLEPGTLAPEQEAPASTHAERFQVDAQGIAMRLQHVANAPKAPPSVNQGGVEELPVVPDTTYSADTDEIRFLGLIREPTRILALVRLTERQTVMWPGRVVDGVKLVKIQEDSITIERDGIESRIERATRKGGLNTLTASPPRPTPMPVIQDGSIQPMPGEEGSREASIEALRRARSEARDRMRRIPPNPNNPDRRDFRWEDR